MTNVNRVTITTIEYKADDFLSKLGLDATESELVRVDKVHVTDAIGSDIQTVKVILESEVEERIPQ